MEAGESSGSHLFECLANAGMPRCRRSTRYVGPGLISLRDRTGSRVLELRRQVLAQLVQARICPQVTGLRRIGSQVVQLPLIVERAHPIRLSDTPIRREVADSRFGPGRRIVEGAHQLPQVALAAVD